MAPRDELREEIQRRGLSISTKRFILYPRLWDLVGAVCDWCKHFQADMMSTLILSATPKEERGNLPWVINEESFFLGRENYHRQLVYFVKSLPHEFAAMSRKILQSCSWRLDFSFDEDILKKNKADCRTSLRTFEELFENFNFETSEFGLCWAKSTVYFLELAVHLIQTMLVAPKDASLFDNVMPNESKKMSVSELKERLPGLFAIKQQCEDFERLCSLRPRQQRKVTLTRTVEKAFTVIDLFLSYIENALQD